MDDLTEKINGLELSKNQERIINILTSYNKFLLDIYIGALRALENKKNPERLYQSAHSLREFGYYLVDDIKRVAKKPDQDETHRKLMKILMKNQDELGGPPEGTIDKEWYKLHNYFVKVCHHRLKPKEQDFKLKLNILENIIIAIFGSFYDSLDGLDKLINIQEPKAKDIDNVISFIKKKAQYIYFFKELKYPSWLEPLLQKGFFKKPPEPYEENESLIIPNWIEAKYLAQISDKKPNQVLKIIKSLSATQNSRVHTDFIDAALKIPTNLSKELIPDMIKWLKNPYQIYSIIPKKITEFVIKLANEDYKDEAFDLMSKLLDFKIEKPNFKSKHVRIPPKISPYVENYIYREICENLIDNLRENLFDSLLEFFCNKLNFSIVLYLKNESSDDISDDLSRYWCTSIKTIENNKEYEIKNILVKSIRNLAIHIAEKKNIKAYNDAIHKIKKYEYLIFRRLELYLYNVYFDISKVYISDVVKDKRLFSNLEKILEFIELLLLRFPSFEKDLQDFIVRSIEKGPILDDYKQKYNKIYHKFPDDEVIDSYLKQWRIEKFFPISSYLPIELKRKYELTDENLERYDPTQYLLPIVQFGYKSPITKSDLEQKSDDDLLEYFEEFDDTNSSFFDFTFEGLGRSLSNLIKSDPTRFSDILINFSKSQKKKKYLPYIILGYKDALKNKLEFDWAPVINIIEDFLYNSDKFPQNAFRNNDYSNLKLYIAWFVRDGLKKSKISIPLSFKEQIWKIIKYLLENEEDTIPEEKNIDFVNIALNSVKGMAFMMLIDYSYWIRRDKKENPVLEKSIKMILETYLKTQKNLILHSIYGYMFNDLLVLDNEWTVSNLDKIFLQNNKEYWDAAWSAYITYNRFYSKSFKLLKREYTKALNLLQTPDYSINYSIQNYIYHIVNAYFLNLAESLVSIFFNEVPSKYRAIAISYIGQNLNDIIQLNEKDNLIKLKTLWESRILAAENSENKKEFIEELTNFSYWFMNSVFENEWVIKTYRRTLELTDGSINVFYSVLDKFIEFIETFPEEVTKCIQLIIKNEVKTHKFIIHIDKFRKILVSLKILNIDSVNKSIDEILEYVGAFGTNEFRDLKDQEIINIDKARIANFLSKHIISIPEEKIKSLLEPFSNITPPEELNIIPMISDNEEILKPIDNQFEIPPQNLEYQYSFPCFILSKKYKKIPSEIATFLQDSLPKPYYIKEIKAFGPYLNFLIKPSIILSNIFLLRDKYGKLRNSEIREYRIVIEYPSPNTNKPLHFGHIRNMLLGKSLSNLLKYMGYKVFQVNLNNDRGIHICKSMIAYKKWGENKEPDIKSDHFVGKYYVKYNEILQKNPQLENETRELLRSWENGDKDTLELWKKMNNWAFEGFKETYKKLGIKFDKEYYESNLYLKGKEIIYEGLKMGLFEKTEDGAIFASLKEKYNLEDKFLIRSDGTSIYMTQDIYLAYIKKKDFNYDRSIYVVGDPQIQHFKWLFAILDLLGFKEDNYHLSYGMIELPEGKMKSREGTVVDADDIISKVEKLALVEVNKRYPDLSQKKREYRAEIIAMAAIKFYILKFSPVKGFIFNPKESISFEGETGPYILYCYARINSIISKSDQDIDLDVKWELLKHQAELLLVKNLTYFPEIISSAENSYNIHIIPQYLLSLCQSFNSFYSSCQVLSDNKDLEKARLLLIRCVQIVIKIGLAILGIDTLNQM